MVLPSPTGNRREKVTVWDVAVGYISEYEQGNVDPDKDPRAYREIRDLLTQYNAKSYLEFQEQKKMKQADVEL